MIHNKMMPWRMAQQRRAAIAIVTFPLVWMGAFWEMWAQVYEGTPAEQKASK